MADPKDPPSQCSPDQDELNSLRIEVNSEGRLARWSKRLTLLSMHTPETVVGRPITDLLVALDPVDLFTQSLPIEGATGLVTFSRPRGVAPCLGAKIFPTATGSEILLNRAAESQVHDADKTATERLRAMLNWVPGFCYTVDTNLVFTSSRGAGLSNIRLSDDQLVGMSLTDLWGTQDPSYEPLQCHLRAFGGLTQRYRDVCVGRSLDYEISPIR